MVALVENRLNVFEIPWHKNGTILENYPSFDDAITYRIIYSGLNFEEDYSLEIE